MASIIGTVGFVPNRMASTIVSVAFSDVTIILQDNLGAPIATTISDVTGAWAFNDLVSGDYIVTMDTPPISAAPSPPVVATNLDFMSQRTYIVTINEVSQTSIRFLLGPVIYSPMNALPDDVIVDPVNIMSCADYGTFGSFKPGTPINTGANPEPYPDNVPYFEYVLPDPAEFTPDDGQYTIQNVMTNNRSNVLTSWWRVSDHTAGDETGRYMLVNGDYPSTVIFSTTVDVKPNTYYLFSGWFLNIYTSLDYGHPHFSLKVTDPKGKIHYLADLGLQIPEHQDAPEWKQIGAILHTDKCTTLTFEFISEQEHTWGNDYCIDDISLNEVMIPDPEFLMVLKTADKVCLTSKDEITFTIEVDNILSQEVDSILLRDNLPGCFSFKQGSVVINDVSYPDYDPVVGFNVDLASGDSVVVEFVATVDSFPVDDIDYGRGVACNTATVIYDYSVIEGGIPVEYRVVSEPVCINVVQVYRNIDGNIMVLGAAKGESEE